MKDGRDRRCAACKERFVAKGAGDEQESRFAGAVIAAHAEIRHLVEGVVHPRQKDVVAREALEARAEVDIAMYVSLNLVDEFVLTAILLRLAWKDERSSPDQVVVRRERYDPVVFAELK